MAESNLFGCIIYQSDRPICENCGEEKIDIMCYGWVCVNCDKPEPLPTNQPQKENE